MAGLNVKKIVEGYLKKNGYSGLYHNDMDCGCELSDLMPCNEDSGMGSCQPGYKVEYPDRRCPCGEGCDFHVHANKQKVKK